jgi:Phosphotransferase enzyme family
VGRTVTLVLVDSTGAVLGALPPFRVATPHWQEVAEVVTGAAQMHGVHVTVLRLLAADGYEVTYLAEATKPVHTPLRTVQIRLDPHPLRAPYADVGGPAATLAWATATIGLARATQLRTWNLSSIWRLDRATGTVWLKEVPSFYRHEGPLLDWLARRHPGFAPRPLAVDGGRMLLADIPGDDRYGASATERLSMMRSLHVVQRDAVAKLAELRALGVRVNPLAEGIRRTVLRYGDPALLVGLDDRLAALSDCGLPDTLVHGDFHPGNVRGSVVLDWGDSVLGQPVFDLHRIVERLPPGDETPLVAEWCRWWRESVPGCQPERAYALSAPLVALRNAMAYADFLDQIEPSEHPYHASDVPAWLARATTLLDPMGTS